MAFKEKNLEFNGGCSGACHVLTTTGDINPWPLKRFGVLHSRWNSLMPLNRDGAVGYQDLGTVGDFYLVFYLVGDYIIYDIIEII